MDALIKLAEIKVKKYKSTDNHNIIVDYIKKNNMIINDDLDDIPMSYHIYSVNPVRDSNNLCNLLYPLNKYVSVQTSIINKIFIIKLDNFPYITVELLYLYNNSKIPNLMSIENEFTILNDISKCMLLCQKLYHPDYFNNIDSIDIVNEKIKSISKNNKIINYSINKGYKYNLINKIFNKLAKLDIDYVFLSYYAINYNNLNFNNPIHIAINVSNYILINLIKTVFNKLIISDDTIYIINDFRLKLQIVSIMIDGRKTPIMYIYNSLSYELFPTIKPHIPTKYVILRFLFMDLMKRQIYQCQSNDVIENIVKANEIENDLELEDVEFVGIYRDVNFDRVSYNKNSGKFVNVYRPLMYERDHNNLRSI